MDVSGGKNLTPTETVSVGVQPSSFSVPFWCYVGQSWAIWDLFWTHVGSFGGLCGAPWTSLEAKI